MKVFSDEEIQKMLESGKAFPGKDTQADFQSYQYLYQALKAEPDFELSEDFSDQLVEIVERQAAYRRNIHYYLLLVSVSFFALILGIVVVAYVNKPLIINLLNLIWEQRWIAFSCMILFLAVQAGDKLLKKYIQHNVHSYH